MVLVLFLSQLLPLPSTVAGIDEDDVDDVGDMNDRGRRRLQVEDIDDWGRRRLQKRREAVSTIKSTPEYDNAQLSPSRPTTPIPSLRFSKREWERCVMDWRQALKDMPPAAAPAIAPPSTSSSSPSDCTTSIECSSDSDT